jgi:hypothetical protein
MIEALCAGTIRRMLIEKAAAACAPVSRDERLFGVIAVDCIDDLFDRTTAVERKRI